MPPTTTRVQVMLTHDGQVVGRVTAHCPYAAADEVVILEPADGEEVPAEAAAAVAPEASADVALEELSLPDGVREQLESALKAVRDAAQQKLARRLSDSVATARQVAVLRGEITR